MYSIITMGAAGSPRACTGDPSSSVIGRTGGLAAALAVVLGGPPGLSGDELWDDSRSSRRRISSKSAAAWLCVMGALPSEDDGRAAGSHWFATGADAWASARHESAKQAGAAQMPRSRRCNRGREVTRGAITLTPRNQAGIRPSGPGGGERVCGTACVTVGG